MKWYKLNPPPQEGVTSRQIAGKKIGIIHSSNKVHAFQARCPHAGGDLTAGWCEKNQIICPVHRYAYNLDTGRGAAGQGDYIRIYPVKEEEGIFWIGLPKAWWKWWK